MLMSFPHNPEQTTTGLTFTVDIMRDPQTGHLTAVCDAPGIITEAADYDALLRRVCDIAPEMYALYHKNPHSPFTLAFPEKTDLLAPEVH